MSKWTGKSDFADWCEMHNTPSEVVEKANVYLGPAKVEIKDEKDLIPYYTNLTAMIAVNHELKKSQSIHLSKDSFIDEEEREFLSWRVEECIKLARKAKKEKVAFTYEWAKPELDKMTVGLRTFCLSSDNIAAFKQIINRINEDPEIIKYHLPKEPCKKNLVLEKWILPEYFYDVHLARFNAMRERFLEFCKENGFAVYFSDSEITSIAGKADEEEVRYSPLLWKMCRDVAVFKDMQEKYDVKEG